MICAGIGLVGCSSPLPRQAEILQTARSCCSSLAQLPISGTVGSARLSAEFTDNSAVFDFPEGRSYFAAFELPPDWIGGSLELTTWHRGNTTLDSQVFCPVVTALDSAKKSLGNLALGGMKFTRAGFIDNAHFSALVEVPKDAAYIVVHTPTSTIGGSLRASVDRQGGAIIVGSGVFFEPGGREVVRIPCGQQGKVSVTLHGD